jgi:hypothetical protein
MMKESKFNSGCMFSDWCAHYYSDCSFNCYWYDKGLVGDLFGMERKKCMNGFHKCLYWYSSVWGRCNFRRGWKFSVINLLELIIIIYLWKSLVGVFGTD